MALQRLCFPRRWCYVVERPSCATQDLCGLDHNAYVSESLSLIKCDQIYAIQGVVRVKWGLLWITSVTLPCTGGCLQTKLLSLVLPLLSHAHSLWWPAFLCWIVCALGNKSSRKAGSFPGVTARKLLCFFLSGPLLLNPHVSEELGSGQRSPTSSDSPLSVPMILDDSNGLWIKVAHWAWDSGGGMWVKVPS